MDAKYEKADLQAVVSANCTHLSLGQQEQLLEVLTEFEDLFNGTLGDWKTKPVSYALKEGMKPYHGRPYPDPKVYKETLMKDLNRLCELGILRFQTAQEWVSPP